MRKYLKAQSAMEYLMTYGWAILIIAVVLGALFSLGIFGANTASTACIAGPGYLCTSLVLNAAGNLSFTFGQSTGSTIYNIGMGCAAVTTSTGQPSVASVNQNAIVYLSTAGAATIYPAANSAVAPFNGFLSMPSGQTLTISGLKCYGTNLAPFGTVATAPAIGTPYSGALWVNYTAASGAPWGSNPVLTSKFDTVSAKVV
jgi:hypothetical protein